MVIQKFCGKREKENYPMDRKGLEKEPEGNGPDVGNDECAKT